MNLDRLGNCNWVVGRYALDWPRSLILTQEGGELREGG